MIMYRTLVASSLVALALVGSESGLAQDLVETVAIETADAVSTESFSLIKGFRELADGRIMVTDWTEERVTVLDLVSGEVRDLGRVGGGPKEFRLPSQLIPLPGDSTLLVDFGNVRMIVISPQLEFVRTIPLNAHGENWRMSPRAADLNGALFFEWSVWSAPGRRRDSVEVGRWSPTVGLSAVGDVQIKAYTSRPPGPSNGLPYIAFSKQDGWAVTPDGWLAVVRSDPYRVDWHRPDGQAIIGKPVAYDLIPVTMDDRRDHVRRWLASTATTGRGGDGGGAFSHVPASQQSSAEIDRTARTALFENEFPPFVPAGVWTPKPDVLWVQRWLPESEVLRFDIFDRTGARRAVVTLPMGRRIIGFGHNTLYATVADRDDLLTIERYPIGEVAFEDNSLEDTR